MWKHLTIVALLVIILFIVMRRESGFSPATYDAAKKTYSCPAGSVLKGNMCSPAPAQVRDSRPARQGMGCPTGKKKSTRGNFCIAANSTDDRTNTIRSGAGMKATYSCPPGTYPEQAGPARATTKCWPNETPFEMVASCPDKNYPRLVEGKCYK